MLPEKITMNTDIGDRYVITYEYPKDYVKVKISKYSPSSMQMNGEILFVLDGEVSGYIKDSEIALSTIYPDALYAMLLALSKHRDMFIIRLIFDKQLNLDSINLLDYEICKRTYFKNIHKSMTSEKSIVISENARYINYDITTILPQETMRKTIEGPEFIENQVGYRINNEHFDQLMIDLNKKIYSIENIKNELKEKVNKQ